MRDSAPFHSLFRLLVLAALLQGAAALANPLQSASIVEEVLSQTSSPHAFDWRRSLLEIRGGYGFVHEANNFENEAFALGVSIPSLYGSSLRVNIRRVNVYSTSSSRMLGRTPFQQAAQLTRYELGIGAGYYLLEGRAFSRLSPVVADLEFTLSGVVGLHYNHENAGRLPKFGDRPKLYVGQERAYSKLTWELGLEWVVYFPSALGIMLEMQYQTAPGTDSALSDWWYFSGGMLWSIQ